MALEDVVYAERAEGRVLRTFPFFVQSWGIDKAMAIAAFREQLKLDMEFIRGYKYWRTKPKIMLDKDFSAGETMYVVIARAFACMEPIPDFEELSEIVNITEDSV